MKRTQRPTVTERVALHPEGVDRNRYCAVCAVNEICVALHPEGVDRNQLGKLYTVCPLVALHPEGVDRNPEGLAI